MQDNNKRNEPKNAPTQTAQINVCGKCRAFDLPPPCRGHGGGGSGGGGGGGGDSKDESKKKENSQSQKILNPTELAAYLLQVNDRWSHVPNTDMALIYKDPGSLLSLKLDNDKGTLIFNGNLGLSAEERETLHTLFAAIMKEFELFKSQNVKSQNGITSEGFSATIKGDNLTITIPNPKLYDLFIHQLMNNNLIPTPSNLKKQHDVSNANVHEGTNDKSSGYKSPTPLGNINLGPRPQGTKKEETNNNK
jgi:hypothetical protein